MTEETSSAASSLPLHEVLEAEFTALHGELPADYPSSTVPQPAKWQCIEISGDVEDAPEHIQFLKHELNFSRVHRLRKHRRGLIGGKTDAQSDTGYEKSRNRQK